MATQPVPFDWQQVDQRLASLMLADVSEEFLILAREDLQHIHYQNIGNGNGMTVPSERLEMHRLRSDEIAARYYAVYCEVWRCQQKPLSPEFLRAICPNSLRMLKSGRINNLATEFSMEQMRTHSLNEEWLKSAMAEYTRSMERLYSKWEKLAEIDSKGLEYMLATSPNDPTVDSPATQVVYARAQLRIVEARLKSIEARINSCERAVSATQMREPNPYRIKSLEQHLASLNSDKTLFESRRDDWQLRLSTALRSPGGGHAFPGSGVAIAGPPRPVVAAPSKRKRVRPRPRCFAVAVELLRKNPNLKLIEFCRAMDTKAEQYPSALKYKPPKAWGVSTFFDQYRNRSNTVSRFLSDVRRHIETSRESR
jgi:hypothetical protein